MDRVFFAAYGPRQSTAGLQGKKKMKAYSPMKNPWSLVATLLLAFSAAASAQTATPTVCLVLPKAQLGQGNNATVDVSEPVRTTLGQYMAGPGIQLVRLDARIPIQINAEAVEKRCSYILQTSVVQKKKGTSMFKKLAPLAGALPMLGGMGGNMNGMIATQVASSAITAGAQQDYAAAMAGAQETNVKAGDTVTVEYTLARLGASEPPKPVALQAKAKQDGEDVIGPMLEQIATAVLTIALAK